MHDHFEWSNDPPPVPVAKLWIPPSGTSYCVVLGPWAAKWVHWMGKRSLPCLDENCPTTRHIKPARWFAYVPVAIPDQQGKAMAKRPYNTPAVLALGREQGNELQPYLGEFPGPALQLFRKAGTRCWEIQKIVQQVTAAELPAAFDPRPTLYRLWGLRPPTQNGQD